MIKSRRDHVQAILVRVDHIVHIVGLRPQGILIRDLTSADTTHVAISILTYSLNNKSGVKRRVEKKKTPLLLTLV